MDSNEVFKFALIAGGAWLLYEWRQSSGTTAAATSPTSPALPQASTYTAYAAGPGTVNNVPFSALNLGAQAAILANSPAPANTTPIAYAANSPAATYYTNLIAGGATPAQAAAQVQQLLGGTSGLPVGALAGLGANPRQMSRENRNRINRAVTPSQQMKKSHMQPVLHLTPTSRARIVGKNYWGDSARSSRQVPMRWVQ